MHLKLIAASLVLAFLTGCNTIAGAGKDIEKGGEAIQNSANKNKNSN
jgi:predicted small secreted protein